jgi:hypothetical protein
MMGDVWEWTSSEYTGYPGFKSGFDEYNDKWFTNQKGFERWLFWNTYNVN